MSGFGFQFVGKVKKAVGTTIEVEGLKAPVGARCIIETGTTSITADITGFNHGTTLLQPLKKASGIKPNSRVKITQEAASIPISDNLIGKVVSPTGEIIMSMAKTTPTGEVTRRLESEPFDISERGLINETFDTGIRIINSMFPIGYGQRIGLFAGTGVGKSMLLSMITKFSSADIVVIGLVGERGREVYEFYHETLDDEARKKAIIVGAPADTSAIMRLQCPEAATTIAEHYRDQGKKVLLLIDSVTRYAQAQREVALASGEAPVTKGYPPSAFSKLPSLIERAGKTKNNGSITAIYTVLTEGDDMNDPIADAARGVLDGHIVLSRELAERGVYPAIDVTASISRLVHVLTNKSHQAAVNDLKSFYSLLKENAELVGMGLIEKGKNKKLDLAIKHENILTNMIKQQLNERVNIQKSNKHIAELSLKMKEL